MFRDMNGSPLPTSTAGGFNGIVIARPAIVIPERDPDIGHVEPQGPPEGHDLADNGENGDTIIGSDYEHSVGPTSKDLRWNEGQAITTSPREKFTMSDSGSTVIAQPRKLPIPNTAANSNATLKGILIKPKRILPAQPGGLKSTRQDHTTLIVPRENIDDCIQTGLNPSRANGVELSESAPHLSVTKLQINVDRLKSYFATQAKGCPNVNSSLGRGANSALCKENDIKLSANTVEQVRSNTECAYSENDGFKHGEIQNWCSKEFSKMTNNMSASKSLDRSIRSPSPKSNTTWDRSSSGYSSDERADPRSPPPTVSSASTVCTKIDTLEADGVSTLQEPADKKESKPKRLPCLDPDLNVHTGIADDNVNVDSKTLVCNYPIPDVCPHSLGISAPAEDKGERCDNNDNIVPDSNTQGPNLQIESQIVPKNISRRPAWTAGLLNSPASGRIQYRKSGTEPMISLRHPNRQTHVESNFDGLEVCGKSYPQTISASSGKTEQQPVSDIPRTETSPVNRPETLTPLSAFSVPDRTSVLVSESGNGGYKLDNNGSEVIRPKVLRQPLSTAKNLKDIKTMTLNMNGESCFVTFYILTFFFW